MYKRQINGTRRGFNCIPRLPMPTCTPTNPRHPLAVCVLYSNLLPYQGGLPDQLQPAVARTTAAPTGMAKGGREKETTRTVADGPTGGLDCPQHVARLINGATTEANASCQPIDPTTSGHADGGASSEVEDVGSLTAATPKCEASTKVPPKQIWSFRHLNFLSCETSRTLMSHTSVAH